MKIKNRSTDEKSLRSTDGCKPLSDDELTLVSGARVYRFTNTRTNATALAGGSAAGATPLVII